MGTTLIEEPGREPRRKGTTLVETPGAPGGGTRLVEPTGLGGGGLVSGGLTSAGAASEAQAQGASPVVGWLVVVGGPGRGRSIELGYGMNIIGRNPGNRVVLDFGDDQISGDDHFRVAYDGTHRQFHLVPGRGTNLVYLGGDPLLAPVALASGNELSVGSTRLRFVALCDAGWSWESAAG